jgi:hypothetical protein
VRQGGQELIRPSQGTSSSCSAVISATHSTAMPYSTGTFLSHMPLLCDGDQ